MVAITSGANMNFERLRLVAELANVGGLTEATMATTIPEQPGAFRTFIDAAVGSASSEPISVTEFKYRFSAGEAAQVLWGAGLKSPGQLASLLARMESAGFQTVDISKVRELLSYSQQGMASSEYQPFTYVRACSFCRSCIMPPSEAMKLGLAALPSSSLPPKATAGSKDDLYSRISF